LKNTPAGRYQVAAYIVGTLLLLLVVAMVMKYGFDNESFMWIALVHGYFYIVYLILAFDLFRRSSWPLRRLAEMILAGLVPGMTFVVERRIARFARSSARLDESGAAAL
jgi:integral membrane protein